MSIDTERLERELAAATAKRAGPPICFSEAVEITKELMRRGLSMPRQQGRRMPEPVDFDARIIEAMAQWPVVRAYLAEH